MIPMGTRVVVKLDNRTPKQGAIWIPKNETDKLKCFFEGTVVSVGRKCAHLKTNMRVLLSEYAGDSINNDPLQILVDERCVEGILEPAS